MAEERKVKHVMEMRVEGKMRRKNQGLNGKLQ